MINHINTMTFSQLKDIVQLLENDSTISNETKLFIDTGWDSIQEVTTEAIQVEKVTSFEVEDELTKEIYEGYCLVDKAKKLNTKGEQETAIIIKNLY
ncbi:hypothetical protein QQG09_02670 [Melissococcus plutonius]|uniref:Uncharacterized protein n=1 Tax=Melissococcus plutonius TaxID=33970 RepID=A0A2Z5Y374_9ENTE|nr:hypothetical protein [Melissococcus plutonius]BAL62316.1 hypothetical protein MPD5_1093 [Melissococcus plutonius DAT561]MCV2498087.1 hypothetical protein [Melissococcus plutonius]MCV2500674.1 hypothetical protein [Melissococcus plutonius]MCV2504360.1 hypothetical protein [Melissococcus plutonius]MCV2506702.1 hypothetical protein [Melissococcus plutonius]